MSVKRAEFGAGPVSCRLALSNKATFAVRVDLRIFTKQTFVRHLPFSLVGFVNGLLKGKRGKVRRKRENTHTKKENPNSRFPFTNFVFSIFFSPSFLPFASISLFALLHCPFFPSLDHFLGSLQQVSKKMVKQPSILFSNLSLY